MGGVAGNKVLYRRQKRRHQRDKKEDTHHFQQIKTRQKRRHPSLSANKDMGVLTYLLTYPVILL